MGSPINHGTSHKNQPLGMKFIKCLKKSPLSYKTHQAIVLIVTFFAYAAYHATRKTTSIVKSALDPRPSDLGLESMWTVGNGWVPFDGPNGTQLLGELDVAFLFVYALGMYFSGHVGDRMDLRLFLTVGMVGTGLFTGLFGVGYWADVHNFYYYLVVQMLAGLFQSTGWPSVVAVVGNWFGETKKRGLIMGIWNAHTSIGNITGSLIASGLLRFGWGWSLVIPGLSIAFTGLVVFLLLPVDPESVGANRDKEDNFPSLEKGGNEKGIRELLLKPDRASDECAVGHTEISGRYLSNEESGNLSTLFDVGGVVGGVLAGYISDRLNARALTAASFVYCSIPALFLYRCYGHVSMSVNIVLVLVTGMFVNGPYALITTAVSADLGTHGSLKGNTRALATVTAIIDGTGSVGAAFGPLLTGYISAKSWNGVFTMLMSAALVAGLLLTRLVVSEVADKFRNPTGEDEPRLHSAVSDDE
ncbi:unnamed protein product [Cuscuta campestris]|uniref:Major facilitator superfamily (MFS) profile domain-containing protein n=1 Tax=Cuscuta campestris TaxID=132261 RepID=A0A484NER6_9ASTE|nr:unnamed protein product [Cuscuta campestris]